MNKVGRYVLDTLSVGGAMLGSLMLATNTSFSKWGYVPFLIGATASFFISWNSNISRSQVFLNCWFVVMNLLGIYRWFT